MAFTKIPIWAPLRPTTLFTLGQYSRYIREQRAVRWNLPLTNTSNSNTNSSNNVNKSNGQLNNSSKVPDLYTHFLILFSVSATFHNQSRDFQPLIYLLETVIDKICFAIEILCFEIILLQIRS